MELLRKSKQQNSCTTNFVLTKLVVGQTTTSQILPSTPMYVAMLVILAIQGMVLVMGCSPVALASACTHGRASCNFFNFDVGCGMVCDLGVNGWSECDEETV